MKTYGTAVRSSIRWINGVARLNCQFRLGWKVLHSCEKFTNLPGRRTAEIVLVSVSGELIFVHS
jgi:hypothetical protein